MIDTGKDLQKAYEEGYKQGRYDEKVETEMSLPQRWIPCSERLPEYNTMVTITAKYTGHLKGREPYVEEGYLSDNGWRSLYGDDYNELLVYVVAWMPLPEPYRGESE